MIFVISTKAPIFIHDFHHQLGSIRRDLNELKGEKLLLGEVEALSAIGYRYNFGLSKDETLLSLTTAPLSAALRTPENRALWFSSIVTPRARCCIMTLTKLI